MRSAEFLGRSCLSPKIRFDTRDYCNVSKRVSSFIVAEVREFVNG